MSLSADSFHNAHLRQEEQHGGKALLFKTGGPGEIGGSKGLIKVFRHKLHVVPGTGEQHAVLDAQGNPVIAMGAALFVPAPPIQKAVFVQVDQEQLEREIGILQIGTYLVELSEGMEKAPPQGRPVFVQKLTGFRVDPDDPFFRRYRIDHTHRILWKKTCQFGAHGIHIGGLDLNDMVPDKNVRDIAVDGDFLMILIGIYVVFEYGMQGLFGLHADSVSLSGAEGDHFRARGIEALPGFLERKIRRQSGRVKTVFQTHGIV